VRKLRPVPIILGVIGLVVGVVGVLALREATLSTHERVSGRGMELVVSAETKGGEEGQTLSEMVEAQLLSCRLEVGSDLNGRIQRLGDGRYRAMLVPALDETDRKQFRGCVEDWIIDHVQIGVEQLTVVR
jgi:hypothetical protein